MSGKYTARECEFVEIESGCWYYILEVHKAPEGAWDWREHAEAFGPFKSVDDAHSHLAANHPHPASFTASPLPDGARRLNLSGDKVLRKLLDRAVRNMAAERRPSTIIMRSRFLGSEGA